jgi:maleylacetoacetate isomerase/maleylpyruvate isomerase
VSTEQKGAWYRHWVALGLQALETQLARDSETGRFCHGDTPTIADCCLVPRWYNACRFECDLTPYPALVAIANRCKELAPSADARPERQADAQ